MPKKRFSDRFQGVRKSVLCARVLRKHAKMETRKGEEISLRRRYFWAHPRAKREFVKILNLNYPRTIPIKNILSKKQNEKLSYNL